MPRVNDNTTKGHSHQQLKVGLSPSENFCLFVSIVVLQE